MSKLKIERRKLIEFIIYSHIFLISVQLVFRELVFDTTFIRDIFLFLILLFWLFRKHSSNYSILNHKIYFTFWVKYLFIYGIIMSIIQIVFGKLPTEVIVIFRNNYLPLSLFFVSKYVFETEESRYKFKKFIYFMLVLFTFDILMEFIAFYIGLPKTIFPWYRYQFLHSYRYTTSNLDVVGQVDPSESPIIGILGWSHATSATLFGLFSFIIPFLIAKLKSHEINDIPKYKRNHPLKIYLLILSFIISLIILGVKMQLVSFFILLILLILLLPRQNKIIIFRTIFVIIFILLVTQQLWFESILLKYETAFVGVNNNESTFNSIIDWDIIKIFLEYIFQIQLYFFYLVDLIILATGFLNFWKYVSLIFLWNWD